MNAVLIRDGVRNFFDLFKAGAHKYSRREGTPGNYKYYYEEGYKPKGKRKLDQEPRIAKLSHTYQHFLPEESEWDGIVHGDGDALANYVTRTMWTHNQAVEDTMLPHSFLRQFPRTNIEGFGLDDLAQEVALALWDKQQKGELNQINRDGFPPYLGKMFLHLSTKLARKAHTHHNQANKEIASDIAKLGEHLHTLTHSTETAYFQGVDERKVEVIVRDASKKMTKFLEKRSPQVQQIWQEALLRAGTNSKTAIKEKEIAATFGKDLDGNFLVKPNTVGATLRTLAKDVLAPILRDYDIEGDWKTVFKNFAENYRTIMGGQKPATLMKATIERRGNLILLKGVTGGSHKYIRKEGDRYIYEEPKGKESAPGEKPEEKKPAPKDESGDKKEKREFAIQRIKQALKGFVDSIAGALSGNDGVGEAAHATEEQGEAIKAKGDELKAGTPSKKKESAADAAAPQTHVHIHTGDTGAAK